MAAQYTEVTLDDMEKFLKRGFRALRPKQAVQNGEYFYDLALSPNVAIRVWTSVRRGSSSGAGVGEDAIRVQLMGVPNKRPLMAGKAPIVKRTQGWRNTLQNKIEDLMESYDEREGYWEARAGGTPALQPVPPPAPPREVEVDDNDGEAYADDEPPPPAPTGEPLYGTFTNYRGEWRARIQGHGAVGAKAILETKGNRRVPVVLQHKVWSGQDNYGKGYVEIWSIEDRGRQAAEEETYDYNRGVN
jgi:hypothetical protein